MKKTAARTKVYQILQRGVIVLSNQPSSPPSNPTHQKKRRNAQKCASEAGRQRSRRLPDRHPHEHQTGTHGEHRERGQEPRIPTVPATLGHLPHLVLHDRTGVGGSVRGAHFAGQSARGGARGRRGGQRGIQRGPETVEIWVWDTSALEAGTANHATASDGEGILERTAAEVYFRVETDVWGVGAGETDKGH